MRSEARAGDAIAGGLKESAARCEARQLAAAAGLQFAVGRGHGRAWHFARACGARVGGFGVGARSYFWRVLSFSRGRPTELGATSCLKDTTNLPI